MATVGSWDAYVVVPGAIDIVNTGTDSVTQTITDSGGPVAVATSPRGVYEYVANTSSVSIIDTADIGVLSNPIVATISATQIKGSEPNTPSLNGIAVDPSANEVLVSDAANGAVDVIDVDSSDGSSYRTVVNQIGLAGSGIGSTTVTPDGGINFSPDGLYAYVTVAGDTLHSYDGVTVLKIAAATTTGYSYSALDDALSDNSTTMYTPSQITINPDDEVAYVTGENSGDTEGGLFSFPIGTNGQLSNGSASPIWTGVQADGVTYSPEDQAAFVTTESSETIGLSSISETYANTNYQSATVGYPTDEAVSPDGLYVGVLDTAQCGMGEDAVSIFDAESGADLADVTLGSNEPTSIAFAPQTSQQTIPTTELAGGASNPAEAGIASGLNDVVSSGTPSDAPGAAAGVDTATGAYSMAVDSMTIQDVGIPLDMTASYDSTNASTLGLLGYGWQNTYGITAVQNAHNAATYPCGVTVTWEDGATSIFYPSAKGPYSTCPTSGYVSSPWVQAKLTFASSCNGSDACFVFTRNNTMSYYVDETTGQLVKVTDQHANAETISWGSHSACSGATSTEPCQVTAPDGSRTLTFSYPSAGSGTCPSGSYTCVVVTDPLGRTVTYVKNSSSQLVRISLSNGTTTATYVFTYTTSTNLMTAWWDPQNNSNHSGSTSYATDVTWTSGKVTQVTGPTMTDAGTSMTSTYVPTTTFTYTDFNSSTGNGTVLIDNPNFNQSPAMYGANQTLDTYLGFELVSSVQGYGPLGAYGSYSLAPTPSMTATPMRDHLTLMPEEVMNPLSGGCVGTVGANTGSGDCSGSTEASEYDTGVTQNTYDASGNLLESIAPTTTTQRQRATRRRTSTTGSTRSRSPSTRSATLRRARR